MTTKMQKVLIVVVALVMGKVATEAADITVVDGGFDGTIENTGNGSNLTLADSTGGWDSGFQDNACVSDSGSAVTSQCLFQRGRASTK
ncbi:MAG: hypothetical protein HC901_03205 [Bdellovibrionaceae bacterium]|nr:hypothetical protein [Pseudobdellovibrionaceae bacterium]